VTKIYKAKQNWTKANKKNGNFANY